MVTITLELHDIMAMIVGVLERSDWIYDKFDEPGMSNKMLWNLHDVLGFLSGPGPATVYVDAMHARMDELIRRSDYRHNFDWPDVRHVIGDSFENGALQCFMAILYNKRYTLMTREHFARLVVCCLFCEKHAGPVGS